MPESKRFLLRLDPKLFDALRRWAADDLRSINAQIEYLLTEQARRAGRLPYERTRRPAAPADIEPLVDASSEEVTEEATPAPARRR
ncbi:MAG TPA: hypothetical protein VMG37_09155 [Solirubrobacteraceae bacterium]|nr:hypothetical protein [Solirubrobacteraceae bacterium]